MECLPFAFPSSVLDDNQSHPQYSICSMFIQLNTQKLGTFYSSKHCESINMDKTPNSSILKLTFKLNFQLLCELFFIGTLCLLCPILQEKHDTNKHSGPFMHEDDGMPLSDKMILK